MIIWYFELTKILHAIEKKAIDALDLIDDEEVKAFEKLKEYLIADCQTLITVWKEHMPEASLANLRRHIGFAERHDFTDILEKDLPTLGVEAQKYIISNQGKKLEIGFEGLLHEEIRQSSLELYRNGHLRESVLNAYTAIFDRIRQLTSVGEDGDRLIGKVMSLEKPHIILSELESESGQNDQKGFMQLYKGAYQGIRNPKAHTLIHDLNSHKAAQYLVFASLLMRRLDEAKIIEIKPG